MRIRVVFIDTDGDYLNRLKGKIRRDYSQELETGYYENLDLFISSGDKNRYDVAVINANLYERNAIGSITCAILFVSEDNTTGKLDECPVVGKYQRFEELYRSILSVYSDRKTNTSGLVVRSGSAKNLITFASPAGGVGSSTLAIAAAEHLSKKGKRVLYLNLENIAFYYYTGNNGGFDDLMYTIKENSANTTIKIESMVRKTDNGVMVLPAVKNSLDLCSLSDEDIEAFITALERLESIDYLIIDTDFSLTKRTYKLFNKSEVVVMTTDGTEPANHKLKMGLSCLSIYEGEYDIISKIRILYNRFGESYFCSRITTELPVLGSIPRYKASIKEIIDEISEGSIFDGLIM